MQFSRSLHNGETNANSDIDNVIKTYSKDPFTPKGNRNEKDYPLDNLIL